MTRLDNEQSIRRFKRIQYIPILAPLSVVFGFVIGVGIYSFTHIPLLLFPSTALGLLLYVVLAYRYKCPNCKTYLWYLPHKMHLKECPKCKIKLK